MFTGLITYVGQVAKIEQADTSARLSITCPPITAEIKIGDSVSVNGVCLTVTDFDKSSFAVDVMVQTLNLSSIGKLLVAELIKPSSLTILVFSSMSITVVYAKTSAVIPTNT